MTNHRLCDRGGSELFVLEVAGALCEGGHEVAVFSTVGGGVSETLGEAGIPFVRDAGECPFSPDIIHGQHHLETMAALAAWPGVPAIYMNHGYVPWEERAPVHPRIVRYLSTAPRMAAWVARECGVEESAAGTIRNFFDGRRFTTVRAADAKTGRALVYHNTMTREGECYGALEEGCREAGLALEGIGAAVGRTIEDPERVLPGYDVVFAGGRSAIEAMACGCTVIPVTVETMASRVHPGNYEALRDVNFCADENDARIESAGVVAELRQIEPEETARVTARVREEATLAASVERLLEEYGMALKAFGAGPGSSLEEEAGMYARYLLSLAERVQGVDAERADLVAQKERAVGRAEKWKARVEEGGARWAWLEGKMVSGSWWQRRLLRKLRREWEKERD